MATTEFAPVFPETCVEETGADPYKYAVFGPIHRGMDRITQSKLKKGTGTGNGHPGASEAVAETTKQAERCPLTLDDVRLIFEDVLTSGEIGIRREPIFDDHGMLVEVTIPDIDTHITKLVGGSIDPESANLTIPASTANIEALVRHALIFLDSDLNRLSEAMHYYQQQSTSTGVNPLHIQERDTLLEEIGPTIRQRFIGAYLFTPEPTRDAKESPVMFGARLSSFIDDKLAPTLKPIAQYARNQGLLRTEIDAIREAAKKQSEQLKNNSLKEE